MLDQKVDGATDVVQALCRYFHQPRLATAFALAVTYPAGKVQKEQTGSYKIYEGNARRVFPRLDAALKAKGK